MKEINIGKTIADMRKEKGITQDDLAAYMGVSKASVSKWETEQSYPDITLLPQLAAYFNISIDCLMAYSPQMTSEDIRKLYHRLAKDFSVKPFGQVHEECGGLIKKYYSCFPLLMQMAVLLLNHHMLAPEEERTAVLDEAIDLCKRVSLESEAAWLRTQADNIRAYCLLIQNRPTEVVDLLAGEHFRASQLDNTILANAYLALGKTDKAKETLQADVYQHVLEILAEGQLLIHTNGDSPEKLNEVLNRLLGLAELFHVAELNFNSMLLLYLHVATGKMTVGEPDAAMEFLQKYTDLCCNLKFPLELHGDGFFDHLDDWFGSLDLGKEAPREDSVIKASMVQGLTANPAFASLAEKPEFQAMVRRLEENAK